MDRKSCEILAKKFKENKFAVSWDYVRGTCYVNVIKFDDTGYYEANLEVSDNIAKYDYKADIRLDILERTYATLLPPAARQYEITNIEVSGGSIGPEVMLDIEVKGRTKLENVQSAIFGPANVLPRIRL